MPISPRDCPELGSFESHFSKLMIVLIRGQHYQQETNYTSGLPGSVFELLKQEENDTGYHQLGIDQISGGLELVVRQSYAATRSIRTAILRYHIRC